MSPLLFTLYKIISRYLLLYTIRDHIIPLGVSTGSYHTVLFTIWYLPLQMPDSRANFDRNGWYLRQLLYMVISWVVYTFFQDFLVIEVKCPNGNAKYDLFKLSIEL